MVYVKATNIYDSVMKTVTSKPNGGFIQKPMDYTINPGETGTAEVYVLQEECMISNIDIYLLSIIFF